MSQNVHPTRASPHSNRPPPARWNRGKPEIAHGVAATRGRRGAASSGVAARRSKDRRAESSLACSG
jgi:hypothetical protein